MADADPRQPTRDTLRAVADRGPARKHGMSQLAWMRLTWAAVGALAIYIAVAIKWCSS